jgi:carbonic anhydrase/acetyltransferase-like protein (isoleucine patch superfamily)
MHIRRIGDKAPSIGKDVYIDPTAVLIGDVVVRDGASVWPCALLRADDERVEVGAGSAVMDMAFAEAPGGHPVTVGDACLISHGARLHGCAVDKACLVGVGAIVLDGARIGEGSIVAAGSVVTPGTQVRPGSVVAGVPAKVLRQSTEEETLLIARELDMVKAKAIRYLAEPGFVD